jgi:hypothetical protein
MSIDPWAGCWSFLHQHQREPLRTNDLEINTDFCCFLNQFFLLHSDKFLVKGEGDDNASPKELSSTATATATATTAWPQEHELKSNCMAQDAP